MEGLTDGARARALVSGCHSVTCGTRPADRLLCGQSQARSFPPTIDEREETAGNASETASVAARYSPSGSCPIANTATCGTKISPLAMRPMKKHSGKGARRNAAEIAKPRVVQATATGTALDTHTSTSHAHIGSKSGRSPYGSG